MTARGLWQKAILSISVAFAAPGCRRPPERTAAAEPSTRLDPALGRSELLRDLEATVLENYQHLSLGNTESYIDSLARDRGVALLGVTPRALVMGRSPPAWVSRRLYANRRPRILSKNLDVHLARADAVGWAYDEVSYRVRYTGREASIPLRTTQLYLRDIGRWVLAAEHVSYALPIAVTLELLRGGRLSPPRAFESAASSYPQTARELLAILDRLHNQPGAAAEVMAVKESSLLLLPDPELEFRGGDIAGAPALATLFGDSAEVEVRDRRVAFGPGREVAWIVANLEVRGAAAETLGLRGTYVFEREEDSWRLVQVHIAVPLEEHELSQRVFEPLDPGEL